MHRSQGLYLHIPFCKRACTYCNFHFSTNLSGRTELVQAMAKELDLRRSELAALPLASIYFGGGTPSLLTGSDLDLLLTTIEQHADWLPEVEITLEANPDDLDQVTVDRLANSAVNRLSIGVQSFFDEDLRFMGRAHNADEARASLDRVRTAGFTNYSLDLIYGSPTTSDAQWADNLRLAIDSGATHISAYALTVEPRTVLAHQIAKGQTPMPEEEQAAAQYAIMMDYLGKLGFEHYELSSFALPAYRSRHNGQYWSGGPYLGFGPSAHGFDGGFRRRWNLANNARYVKTLKTLDSTLAYQQVSGLYETEVLSPVDRYNETIMTALRTSDGLNIGDLEARFGTSFRDYFLAQMQSHLTAGRLLHEGDHYRLARSARFLADGIAADGFRI